MINFMTEVDEENWSIQQYCKIDELKNSMNNQMDYLRTFPLCVRYVSRFR